MRGRSQVFGCWVLDGGSMGLCGEGFGGLVRCALGNGDVDGIRENPECPTVPSCQAGLSQVSFGAIAARAVDRQIKGLGFLLRDLVAITNNANHCCARRAWNPDVERRARIPCDGIARTRDRSS